VSTKTGEVLPVKVRGKDVESPRDLGMAAWRNFSAATKLKWLQHKGIDSKWAKKDITYLDPYDREDLWKSIGAAVMKRKANDDLDLPEDWQPERHSAELLKANNKKRPFSIRRQGERQPSLFGQTFHGENVPKEANDAEAVSWQVWSRGGSIGNKGPSLISEHPTQEEAAAKAKRMNKLLSPGEKSYYGLGYGIKEKSKAKDAAKTHKFIMPTASTEKFPKCCFCGKTEFNGLHKIGGYSATRAGMLQRDLDQMKTRAFQREQERTRTTDHTRMHRALDRALDVVQTKGSK
jgi:hypothetical protein